MKRDTVGLAAGDGGTFVERELGVTDGGAGADNNSATMAISIEVRSTDDAAAEPFSVQRERVGRPRE